MWGRRQRTRPAEARGKIMSLPRAAAQSFKLVTLEHALQPPLSRLRKMAANLPEKLRTAEISRFALRAAQLEKIKPIISYWCKFAGQSLETC